MKRLIALIIFISIPLVWAAPVTFTISFTIPSQFIDEIKVGYLECTPVPMVHSDPNDPTSPVVPKMSDKDWILGNARKEAMKHVFDRYDKGKEIIDARNRVKREEAFE